LPSWRTADVLDLALMAGDADAAGAVVTPDTLARARIATLDPRACLVNHDSFSFFEGIGDLIQVRPAPMSTISESF
jgi:glycerate-2-kinase